ncbi:glycoside hydrolase family 16 protein [Actinocorallia libanotica]|uniref:Glycoside hydrolase family 16 protein n=1 Tax=Actinocorallia libanotica TaxID=46162 RepID=A0ABN1RUM9_9ACTN
MRRSTLAVLCAVSLVTGLSAWRLGGEEAAPAPSVLPVAQDSQAPLFTLPKTRWKKTWGDEFNGEGAPSRAWRALSGGTGWGHEARQYYTPANARQDGYGNLVITAEKAPRSSRLQCWYGRCTHLSARIQTDRSFTQTYGRFAARVRIPTGNGVWPAFWMQRKNGGLVGSPTYGEIDVIETRGQEPHLARGYAHAKDLKGGGVLLMPEPLEAGYHVYGVDWTPKSITWWVDGKPYAQLPRYKNWPFAKPFFLVLSLQVGGSWVGPPDRTTRFPARLTVDWIRTYKAS